MIRVTLDYTASLGPEADMPALVEKIAARLTGAGFGGEHVFVCARSLSLYSGTGGDWETLVGRVVASPATARSFENGLLAELMAIAEDHLAELGARRSIAIAFDLEAPSPSLARLRPRPSDAPGF